MARAIDPAALIEKICNDLHAAQMFLPNMPVTAGAFLRTAAEDICRLVPMLPAPRRWSSLVFTLDRLRFNLQVARQHAEIAPDVATAYARGCRFELGKLSEELAKHADDST